MSVVKINAISVPQERREEFEGRFAARAGQVSGSPGFEMFELLRPTDDRDLYLVYTRWSSEDDFQAWVQSPAFAHGHRAHDTQGPVSSHSELWGYDVVQHEDAPRDHLVVETLLDFHKIWGYVAIGANALVGVVALVAWQVRKLRGRWLWIATIVAESAMMLQVVVGAILVASKDYTVVRFHMFYGFLAFLTVGLAYQYRRSMRGRLEMFYGLVGLFLMGLGIRAVMQVSQMPDRVRVLLLFGGRSAEHDVSRTTAAAVARALDPARYEIVPVAITTDGRWLTADSAQRAIDADVAALPAQFEVEGSPAAGLGELVADPSGARGQTRGTFDVDVVFPLLHGPYGEDGTVQGLLELAGLPYVGSGVVGSAVGMDKVMMKRAFIACGLPTPAYLAFWGEHDLGPFVERVDAELGYPCFVKPANLGSSVGVAKAHDRAELESSCGRALEFDEWIIVEEAIDGREIEVAVLGDNPPATSVPGEIVPGDEFYSYADKYESDAAQLLAPAPLTQAQAEAAQELARAAFEACRLEAMARVDLFLEERAPDGSPGRGFFVNEVNTIPGFTPISMYPKLWQVSGLSYATLLDRLIDLAFERHARRSRRAGRQRDDV